MRDIQNAYLQLDTCAVAAGTLDITHDHNGLYCAHTNYAAMRARFVTARSVRQHLSVVGGRLTPTTPLCVCVRGDGYPVVAWVARRGWGAQVYG